MNRKFERAARARRRKAAIITAVFTTGFFYLLTIGGSGDFRDYLPEFIEQYLPATETPAPPAAKEPVATHDAVRP
jgi:hypothetical protein